MKKKNDLKKLALLGITGGVLLTSQGQAEQSNAQSSPGYDVWSTYAAGGCASCRSSSGSAYGGSSYSGYTSGAGCGATPHQAYYSSCSGFGGYSSGSYDGYSGYSSGGGCGASAPSWGGQGYYAPSHSCASYDHDPNTPPNSRWQQHQQNKQQQQQQYQQDHQGDQQQQQGQQRRSATPPPPPPAPTSWRNTNKSKLYSENDIQTSTAPKSSLTESELRGQLSDDGKRMFDRLDAEGKKLALRLANQDCKGKNSCKGENACKTSKNDCAGKGGCAGTSPAPFKDPNQAVKVAAKKMEEKRANLNGGPQTNAKSQTRTPNTYR